MKDVIGTYRSQSKSDPIGVQNVKSLQLKLIFYAGKIVE
jgi:hypothetical protein